MQKHKAERRGDKSLQEEVRKLRKFVMCEVGGMHKEEKIFDIADGGGRKSIPIAFSPLNPEIFGGRKKVCENFKSCMTERRKLS